MRRPRLHLRRSEARGLAAVLAEIEAERAAAPPTSAPSLTCPRCARTTYHPEDVRQGYCVACNDWTSPSAYEREHATPPED